MDRYVLFMARKMPPCAPSKELFLTGISRRIVKHSGNLGRTVGMSEMRNLFGSLENYSF